MKLYGGIDLHSSNSMIAIIDESDKLVYQKRVGNDLSLILKTLLPYQSQLSGLVVESTFNWYWLVDGLMEAGYQLHLANTAAIKQYEGKKYTDDLTDACWLAHLLRLGILPEGYIYPKESRPVRDLLRKRMQLVQQRSGHIVSLQSLLQRQTGQYIHGNQIKQLGVAEVEELLSNPELVLAAGSHLSVMHCLDVQIERLERVVLAKAKEVGIFKLLHSVPGIGDILGLTIWLETGAIVRFDKVGQYASYCRCVESKRISNAKKKGENNRKNGNKFLAWAFIEAANFAVRYYPKVKQFYQRKKAKSHGVLAIKAVAHKLARASYYVMRDKVPFEMKKSFV